jgi:hypothetical protein
VRKPTTTAEKLTAGAIVVQGICAVVMLLVPFGFDKPSSWGLDFDDFLLVLKVYGIAVVLGSIAAFVSRRPALGIGQIAIPAIAYCVMYL